MLCWEYRTLYYDVKKQYRWFFEPTEKVEGWRRGGKDESRATLSASSKTLFCGFVRASLHLRTSIFVVHKWSLLLGVERRWVELGGSNRRVRCAAQGRNVFILICRTSYW